MADRDPKAFWSYTRRDDEHARGKLSSLRKRLAGEIEAQLGTFFEIFQDTVHVLWGAQWQQRLLGGIDESIFFIPLVSPRYFRSSTCRAELEAFRQREQKLLYENLILPVYWIDIDLRDDDLAKTIMSRNYVDFREFRHQPTDSAGVDEKVAEIAAQLIKRLKEFENHQRDAKNMKASITMPKDHDRVAQKVQVTGTAESVPKDITLWLVVEGGGKYHPQGVITEGDWKTSAIVGTKELGTRSYETPIHIVATTTTANEKLMNYLAEQQKLGVWNGLPLPVNTRILDTKLVRRDDHASALGKLIGTYDEYRAKPPQATEGSITIEGTAYGDLAITAVSKTGDTVWTGNITVDPTTGKASATYRYPNSADQGTLELEQSGDDEILVTGKDIAAPNKPFHMMWRKRAR